MNITITIPAHLAYSLRQACGKYKTNCKRSVANATNKEKSEGLQSNSEQRLKSANELFELIDEPTQAQAAITRKVMKCHK